MDTVFVVISWLLLAAVFIIIEIITLGLTTIWFAGGAFIAAIAAIAGANLPIQIVLFVIVSVALLALTRPLAVKHLDNKIQKTNVESLIGQTAIVLQDINNLQEEGQAKINGMEWTARAKEDADLIEKGTAVRVVEIKGVKLIVERIEESQSEETKDKTLELDDDIIKTV